MIVENGFPASELGLGYMHPGERGMNADLRTV
jgi:hypothetical protein